jgi:hypothetical protein
MGAGPQQPVEGSLKAVQINLATGQEPLQDLDPVLRRSSEIRGSASAGSLSSSTPAHYPQIPGSRRDASRFSAGLRWVTELVWPAGPARVVALGWRDDRGTALRGGGAERGPVR